MKFRFFSSHHSRQVENDLYELDGRPCSCGWIFQLKTGHLLGSGFQPSLKWGSSLCLRRLTLGIENESYSLPPPTSCWPPPCSVAASLQRPLQAPPSWRHSLPSKSPTGWLLLPTPSGTFLSTTARVVQPGGQTMLWEIFRFESQFTKIF